MRARMIGLFGMWTAIAIHTGAGCAASPASDLKIRLGDTGLASLQYHGEDLLSDGALGVQHVTFSGVGGQSSDGDLKVIASTVNAQSHKVKRTYSWGAVSCVYAVQGDRLNLTIGVQNTSDSTVSSIAIQPLELKFPQAPQGWVPNYVYLGANQGAPTVEYANYGSGALAVCNDDVVRPLAVGFPGRESLTVRPILVATSSAGQLSSRFDPVLKRPIASHSYDKYSISLRFGSASSTEETLSGDLLKKFAAKYPPTLRWKDRRSIGTLHLSTSEPDHHSVTNPRGWFLDPTMDVKTPAGKEALRKRLLEYADNSIKVLKKMNAQGMITWDIEGQEYPHATSYIGDPRIVKEMAPEMDAMADAYFKKFHDAGLRTGVCVRPQQLSHTPAKTEQQDVADPAKIVALLYDKIAYANKRWGCTLFYVDSNGDPGVPFDVTIFQRLAAKLAQNKIDALIMPEHQNTRYYGCAAPYDELAQNVTSTPELVRAVYPGAFSVIYAPDGPLEKDHDQLVAAVKRGDILLFRGWWDDPQNPQILKIYQDAGR
ncbi:MAG: hypothetical protein ABIY70_23520 [Capsulimonas sp.]|uniref:hypothetical protein n=1 Tax=Capsulimonas sp. TaxID=2494211 RepID=UPI0032665BBF